MKKYISPVLVAAILISIVFIFSSCLKDNCRHTYKLYLPVLKKLSELRSSVQSLPAAKIVNTGKLYISGNWIFLNEQNKGLHVIDNSDPSHPVNTSFINIPGNIDMYSKGNILYADLYCDLTAINIADPKHISVSKFVTNMFPDRIGYNISTNPDSINIITEWLSRDTTVDCSVPKAMLYNDCINCSTVYNASTPGSASAGSQGGNASGAAGGSMARFAAVNNYMYAATTRELNVINISNAGDPLFVNKQPVSGGVETIFPYNNKLFIGAGSNMSIYDLQDPTKPAQQSWSGHWCSHDPVVADDNYAYVTLHNANTCNATVNQLEVYSLATASSPTLIKTYPLSGPLGLSKDGNLLFVCDDGLKIYDATDVTNLKMLKQFSGIDTYDVIANNGIAFVVAKDGLYQFDYSDTQNFHLLSKLLK